MRILLLSAYDAGSHRRWREGLVAACPQYHWQELVLPPRYFNWRIRGNSLSWAYGQRDLLQQPYDLLIATSMVDLANLKGLVPSLAAVPAIVYFHENQFAYPRSEQQHPGLEPQLVNLYSALAAQRVVFNSAYNRDSFLQGAGQLLDKLPDFVPPGVIETLQQRSQLLPVPLEDECFQVSTAATDQPLHIVWNHRWEYDKGPLQLLQALEHLLAQKVDFNLSLLGQQFRRVPPAFEAIKALLGDNDGASLLHYGYVEDVADYRQILVSADVVVSTALHDFQGLSVLEAVAAGCQPLLPGRLCYGEWFSAEYLYPSSPENSAAEAAILAQRLTQLAEHKKRAALPVVPSVAEFSWTSLKADYHALLDEVVAQAGSLYDRRP